MRFRKCAAVLIFMALALITPEVEGLGNDGDAQAKWQPPRTPDGQPDLQGYWRPEFGSSYNIENIELDEIFQGRILGRAPDARIRGRSRIVDPSDGKIPYLPWAAAKHKEFFDNHANPKTVEQIDPQAKCHLSGVPRYMYAPLPYQILQTKGHVVILHEETHAYRTIPLDGRAHIGGRIQLWMGDSRGRWEGNTLVVDTTNLTGKTWFDMTGNFQSDGLHVVERFTLVDADRIRYEATIEDAKLYTRAWKLVVSIIRVEDQDYEIFEYACYEGNRAPELMLAR